MNKKWKVLRQQFLTEHFSTEITLTAWCKRRKLSIHSARRYIKVRAEQKLFNMRKNIDAQVQKETFDNSIENHNMTINQLLTVIVGEKYINKDLNEIPSTKKRILFNEEQWKFITKYNLEFIKTYEEATEYKLFLLNSVYEAKIKLMKIRNIQFSLMSEMKQLGCALNSSKNLLKSLSIYEKLAQVQEELSLQSELSIPLSTFIEDQEKRKSELRILTSWMFGAQVN